MISSISLFEAINALHCAESEGRISDPNILLCIPKSDATAAGANLIGIKTLLANGLSTFFNKGKTVFSVGLRCLPIDPPECTILDS